MNDSRQASIVISNYNYGRFLREAIDSALGQTYANTEVILVDDGSTDESREIIASYGERIIRVLKENGGMASTYNAGFAASRGEVIFFLDSDDVLLPSAVEEALPLFDSAEVAKAHWPLWVVDGRGARTGGMIPAKALGQGNLRSLTIAEGPDCYISPPTTGNAWSRKVLQEILPAPETEYKQHADTYLTTLAPIFGSIKRISEPQGCYRLHGQNDYACETADEKNRRNLEIYHHRCVALSKYLRASGVDIDPEVWKKGNTHYEWMRRLLMSTEEIKQVIPTGEAYILVDEDQWGDKWGGGEVVGVRRHIPFLERGGQYWGPPPDDATAIEELKRLRRQGANFIVFAWPSFWWLDFYSQFHRYLRSEFRCILENDRILAFSLWPKV